MDQAGSSRLDKNFLQMISPSQVEVDRDKGNFHYDTDYSFDAGVGLSEDVIRYISEVKEEDPWLRFPTESPFHIREKTNAHSLGN